MPTRLPGAPRTSLPVIAGCLDTPDPTADGTTVVAAARTVLAH